MIYLGVFAVMCVVALWCFRLDAAQARLLNPLYRAFGLASDRDSFVSVYRFAMRGLGALAILLLALGLALR